MIEALINNIFTMYHPQICYMSYGKYTHMEYTILQK